jgi:hypothetical protein
MWSRVSFGTLLDSRTCVCTVETVVLESFLAIWLFWDGDMLCVLWKVSNFARLIERRRSISSFARTCEDLCGRVVDEKMSARCRFW